MNQLSEKVLIYICSHLMAVFLADHFETLQQSNEQI